LKSDYQSKHLTLLFNPFNSKIKFFVHFYLIK